MKRSRKSKLVISISVILGVLVLSFILGCIILFVDFEPKKSVLEVYAERWEITFPEDAKIEYNFSTQDGFFGDGENYTVIKFESRPDEFLESFTKDEGQVYANTYERIVSYLLKNKEYFEDREFDESKLVYPDDSFMFRRLGNEHGDDVLVMAYDENTNTLYYVEHLI